ncbi:MAG: hypothetical protein WC972_04865 [Trueperaceae bacterium]
MTDFSLYAGDTKSLAVEVKDDAGDPVSLDGVQKVRWQLGKAPNKAPLIEKALGAGLAVTDSAGGAFVVSLDSEDTETLKPGDYYHEAEVIDADDNVSTVLAGTVTILPTLIKPEA